MKIFISVLIICLFFIGYGIYNLVTIRGLRKKLRLILKDEEIKNIFPWGELGILSAWQYPTAYSKVVYRGLRDTKVDKKIIKQARTLYIVDMLIWYGAPALFIIGVVSAIFITS